MCGPRPGRTPFFVAALTVATVLWFSRAAVARADAGPWYLPVLRAAPAPAECTVAVDVRNTATTPAVAALVVWDEPAFCEPQAAGPREVRCSNLIAPGGRWQFNTWELPTGATSAALYSFDANAVVTVPATDIDGIVIVPEHTVPVCDALRETTVGDMDDYRRFALAWRDGGSYLGAPVTAWRGPDLSTTITRDCAAFGPAPAQSVPVPAAGAATTQVRAGLLTGATGPRSYLYLQNTGPRCTWVDVAFDNGGHCAVQALAEGESYALDVAACAGTAGGPVTATVTSSEPIAVAVETYSRAPKPEDPPWVPTPVAVAPSPLDARVAWLPVLNYWGDTDRCGTVIQVENPPGSTEPAVAVLVTWGESGFCEPQMAGPLNVECTGLIRPGGHWSLYGSQLPTGSFNGEVYSLTTRRLSEIGVAGTAADDTVGGYLCERLFYGIVGDGDDTRRFRYAYRTGATFFGVPMGKAAGPPLRTTVARSCGAGLTSVYAAVAPAGLSQRQADGRYRLDAGEFTGGPNGPDTVLYVQNTGDQCTTVEVSLSGETACGIATLPAGESRAIGLAKCVGGRFAGGVTLASEMPLAVIAETYGTPPNTSPGKLEPPRSIEPPPARAQLLRLPVLTTGDELPECMPAVTVANPPGAPGPAIAVVLAWGHSDFCDPQSEGPVNAECSGLIQPGATWVFGGANPWQYYESAEVYSFTDRPLSEVAPAIGRPDVTGAYLCETLFFDAVGDPDDTRRARLAYMTGGTFDGVPMDRAAGPPLEVTVARTCQVAGTPVEVKYGGRGPADLTQPGPDSTYVGRLTDLAGGADGRRTLVYLQNAGLTCTWVRLDLSNNKTCELGALAPGTRETIDVTGCAGDQAGDLTATVTSIQPLALVADTFDNLEGTGQVLVPPPAVTVDPPPVADRLTHLPVLRYLGAEDSCVVAIQVTNPAGSAEPAQAVLVTWGDPDAAPGAGQCEPRALGPLKSECSGLIAPGGAWTFYEPHLPAGAATGAVYSFNLRRLSEIAPEQAEDDLVGTWFCEQFFFQAVGHADVYRQARLAYQDGGLFMGVPMDEAAGPPLAVAVARNCLVDDMMLRATYGALPLSALSAAQPDGTYRGSLAIGPSAGGWTTLLHVQNAGATCTWVQVTYGGAVCGDDTLPPGESSIFDLGACAPGVSGAAEAVVTSVAPLALLAEKVPVDVHLVQPVAVEPGPPVDPAPGAATVLRLPVLNQVADAAICAAQVEVSAPAGNAGPTVAVLVSWTEPDPCVASPKLSADVTCSGLIAPGGRWMFYGNALERANSAELFSLTPRRLSEIGAKPVGTHADDLTAGYLCAALHQALADRPADAWPPRPDPLHTYEQFKAAVLSGTGDFAGVPMAAAAGPPLTAVVRRNCSTAPTATIRLSYAALTPAGLSPDDGEGRYRLTVDDLVVDVGGHSTPVYIQNAGGDRATIHATARADGRRVDCPLPLLNAGTTHTLDLRTCAGAGFAGSLELSSDQPLAARSDWLAEPLPVDRNVIKSVGYDSDPVGRVVVAWRTGDERAVDHFDVLRARGDSTTWQEVNAQPIPPKAGANRFACYRLDDWPGVVRRPAGRGNSYYQLRITGRDGTQSNVQLGATSVQSYRLFLPTTTLAAP
jgi:hypothetical protein